MYLSSFLSCKEFCMKSEELTAVLPAAVAFCALFSFSIFLLTAFSVAFCRTSMIVFGVMLLLIFSSIEILSLLKSSKLSLSSFILYCEHHKVSKGAETAFGKPRMWLYEHYNKAIILLYKSNWASFVIIELFVVDISNFCRFFSRTLGLIEFWNVWVFFYWKRRSKLSTWSAWTRQARLLLVSVAKWAFCSAWIPHSYFQVFP